MTIQIGPHTRQTAAPRKTEGGTSTSTFVKSGETRRQRGRPPGSKNKPKGIMPKEIASEFLGVVKDILPPEHYEEMRKAVQEGKSISTLAEAKITLKLMGPPIWKRLIAESKKEPKKPKNIDDDMLDEIGEVSDSPKDTGFARDLNERLKVYMTMLQFVDSVEKRLDEAADTRTQPNIAILAARGIDGDRLRLLVGSEPRSVGGNVDGVGGAAIEAGTIPDSLPERPVGVPHSEQGETTRVLDGDSHRDDSRV